MSRLVRRTVTTIAAVASAIAFASCGTKDESPPSTKLTEEELMDPESCKGCHPSHFREWSGSMHAYAGEDPLFIAMNKRMQRLTNGTLGNFCVQCHAPVAVRLGKTNDGLNLADLPPKLRGVTCFYCHASLPGGGDFNNPLLLQHDGIMRGGLPNPVPNTAHAAEYSRFHDREAPEGIASVTCGPCHDIVTGSGTNIERTFKEWTQSVYATGDESQALACGQCHMPSKIGVAAQAPHVYARRVHDHSMPGVDTALVPFPEAKAQRDGVQRILDDSLFARLCVRPGAGGFAAEVSLRSVSVGHGFPSGSAQDRRAWVEVVAYRGTDVVFRSGTFRDDEEISPAKDPALLLLRDRIFRADGSETHNFWEATKFESKQLLPPTRNGPASFDPFVRKTYTIAAAPDRVTMAVHVRAVDVDIVEDLVASGDLADATLAKNLPTFTLASTQLEWSATRGDECVTK